MLLDATNTDKPHSFNDSNKSVDDTNITNQILTVDPKTLDTFLSLDEMDSAEVKLLMPTIIYLVIISVCGMLGNSLVIQIYRTKYEHSNSRYFILCLSAIELFSCCVAIPLEVATILKQYNFDNPLLCKFSRCFNHLGTCSASFSLLFIAIDRYRKVCKPFEWQIKANIAKFLSAVSVILGACFALTAIFVYGKKNVKIPRFNMTGSECSTAEELKDSAFPFIFALIFGLFFITWIAAMFILYCFIGKKVIRQAQKMKLQTTSSMTSSFRTDQTSTLSSIIASDTSIPKHKQNDTSCNTNKITKVIFRQSKTINQDNENCTDNTDFEPSYTQLCTITSELHVSREKMPNETNSNEIKKKYNYPELDDKDFKVKSEKEYKEKEIDIKNNVGDHQDNQFGCRETVDTNDKNVEIPPTSSQEITPKQTNNILKRTSSVGGRMSNVILRVTSITRSHRSKNSRAPKKTAFSKQARARKTAFLMFVITFAFFISYLPHLLLMLIRQIKGDFVDGLSDRNRAVYRFFLRSYFLNCAINPIIYSVCDSRFRTAIKEILNQCFRRIPKMTGNNST